MVYYIRKGPNSILNNMKIKDNECQILNPIFKNKSTDKIVKRFVKKNINQVILSKEMEKNKELKKNLKNYDITIFDGKWLMQYIVKEIIDFWNANNKEEDDEIAILVNDLTYEAKKNIKELANDYKKIRIVTNHLEKIKTIEKQLYEDKGISIIATNNKRKALAKTTIIVNFDFVQEIINQYNINEKAIIINLSDNIKIIKKRFCGFVVNDYELKLEGMDTKAENENLNIEEILKKESEFSLKEMLEGNIYTQIRKTLNYNTFEQVRNIIKKYNVQIQKIIGVNGILEKKEVLKNK